MRNCGRPPCTPRSNGKSAETIEKETPKELPLRKRVRNRVKTREFIEWSFLRNELVNHNTPTPLFFVSVASKGFSPAVSLLFATLAGRSISVAAKGLTRTKCWQESNWVGAEDSEGVRRTTWRASMVRRALSFPTRPESAIAGATAGRRKNRANYRKNYSILVQLVK